MCEQQTTDLLPVTDTVHYLENLFASCSFLSLSSIFFRPCLSLLFCLFFPLCLKSSFYFILHFLSCIYWSALHRTTARLNLSLISWQLILLPEDVSQDVAFSLDLLSPLEIFLWKWLVMQNTLLNLLKAPPDPQKGPENTSPALKQLY